MAERSFEFQPRWKEELVVTRDGRSLVLELPMVVLTAYLPTEAEWRQRAPGWAIALWPVLKTELSAWCAENRAELVIDPSADFYPA